VSGKGQGSRQGRDEVLAEDVGAAQQRHLDVAVLFREGAQVSLGLDQRPLRAGLTAQFLFDAVHDHGGVGRNGAGVVGDRQGAAVVRNLLEPFPFGPEPAMVNGSK
jgi:hypothetical protein